LLGAAAKALISGKSGADVATWSADGKDRLRAKPAAAGLTDATGGAGAGAAGRPGFRTGIKAS